MSSKQPWNKPTTTTSSTDDAEGTIGDASLKKDSDEGTTTTTHSPHKGQQPAAAYRVDNIDCEDGALRPPPPPPPQQQQQQQMPTGGVASHVDYANALDRSGMAFTETGDEEEHRCDGHGAARGGVGLDGHHSRPQEDHNHDQEERVVPEAAGFEFAVASPFIFGVSWRQRRPEAASQPLFGFGAARDPNDRLLMACDACKNRAGFDRDEVLACIDEGADANVSTNNCHLPLFGPIFEGDEDIVTILLDAGADVRKVPLGERPMSPLELACRLGPPSMVMLLERRGADLVGESQNGWLPFHHACYGGNIGMVNWFLNNINVDVNQKTNDSEELAPLHLVGENLELVRLLVEHGAEVDAENSDGETALHCLYLDLRPSSETIKYLVEHGANVHAKTKAGHSMIRRALSQPRLQAAEQESASCGYAMDGPLIKRAAWLGEQSREA